MPQKQRFTLYFSSGLHLTKNSKRIEGLPVDPDSVDIVFQESATHNPPPQWAIITNWVAVPLICLFIRLYLFVLEEASRFGLTDAGVVDKLRNAGADVIQTDRNLHRILASGRWYWGALHWAVVVKSLFGLGTWIHFMNLSVSIVANPVIDSIPARLQAYAVWGFLGLESLVWFLIAGAIMGGFFIQGTIEARNYAILNQIEEHVEANPNSSIGCIVVGGAHTVHLKELVKESDVVELGEE